MAIPMMVEIADPSGVAEARRHAAALAERLEFDEVAAGQLAIAVTELGTNIVKHAGRGRLAFRALESAGMAGIEVLSMDQGPGIANMAESLRDGHSTSGTPGTGLGALQRVTSDFEVYSQAGKGTLVRIVAWQRSAPRNAPLVRPITPLEHGAISMPVAGEEVCGDDWTLATEGERVVLLVVDGLGHGPDAAAAARAATEALHKHARLAAAGIMDAIHGALRPTRGAAGAVAILEPRKELCTYCGVGNIAATIRSGGQSRSMVSLAGILGHQVRKFQEFSYPFPRDALCIAHSDGLSARWDLGAYAGLDLRHPALVCAALFRDHRRERDDASVVAVRNAAQAVSPSQ